MKVEGRYDSFQQTAVRNVISDFREDASGRFLLVIPTGGGKTTTAVKVIGGLYKLGLLSAHEHVMWVVHRDELRNQAKASILKFAQAENRPELLTQIDILMLSGVKQYLLDYPEVRFAVIDEAHHVAAKSYLPLFDQPKLGILGLTATPSRHDGQPLQFTRESYSIGFPDLVSMGVLLRPNVIRVDGGSYDISNIGDNASDLELLNNHDRNNRILNALAENNDKIHKAIIYVGTKTHAQELFRLLKPFILPNKYESVGIILGDDRRRYIAATKTEIAGESRKDFIDAQKTSGRSILVNVDVLTEGYDDPTVNAIVMARPTNSKLVYMQALGRAVRIDPNNAEKEAYVIEVIDTLPNIKYRIDNRWLYSDISDLLEPDVIDVLYSSPEILRQKIAEIFDKYEVPMEYRVIPDYSIRDRVTMLLFKIYVGNGKFEHVPLIIKNDTRQAAAAFFNFLASRIKSFHGLDAEQVFHPVLPQAAQFAALEDPSIRKYVLQALENAWDLVATAVDGETVSPTVAAGRPWITFVAFRLEMDVESLGDDLLKFTEDMLNRDAIRATLRTNSIDSSFFLVKFPLPLRGSWGVFLPANEFAELQKTIAQLQAHANEPDGVSQWQAAISTLGMATVSVEHRHIQSLTTIVRENLDYFRSADLQITRDVQ